MPARQGSRSRSRLSRPTAGFSVALRRFAFLQQAPVQVVPRGGDRALAQGGKHPAAGFVQVGAVVEAALPRRLGEFRESTLDLAGRQVLQPEGLEARGIDQVTAWRRQVVSSQNASMASSLCCSTRLISFSGFGCGPDFLRGSPVADSS